MGPSQSFTNLLFNYPGKFVLERSSVGQLLLIRNILLITRYLKHNTADYSYILLHYKCITSNILYYVHITLHVTLCTTNVTSNILDILCINFELTF